MRYRCGICKEEDDEVNLGKLYQKGTDVIISELQLLGHDATEIEQRSNTDITQYAHKQCRINLKIEVRDFLRGQLILN